MVFVGTIFMGCVEICILIQWVSCIRVGKASHGLDSILTGLALWMRCGHLMICYKLNSLLSIENGIIFFLPWNHETMLMALVLKEEMNKQEGNYFKSKDTLADLIFTSLDFFFFNLQKKYWLYWNKDVAWHWFYASSRPNLFSIFFI